jgi:hypothetical protein
MFLVAHCKISGANRLWEGPTTVGSCIRCHDKYRTTSAVVGDLLRKSIKWMFGTKIEMVQGFELQYFERLLAIFEVFEKRPREQRVHFRRFHFTPRAVRKSMNLGLEI